MTTRKKKTTVVPPTTSHKFTLHKMKIEEFLNKNYFDLKNKDDKVAEEITKVECVTEPRKPKTEKPFMFLDQNKLKIVMWGNMMAITKGAALQPRSTKPCWWCRNKFTGFSLGLPISYENDTRDEKMKEMYLDYLKQYNLVLTEGTDYFNTEGLFCCIACMKAYCFERITLTKLAKYKKALNLITLLQIKVYGDIQDIKPADSWKMLTEYGGHKSISEFRNDVHLLEYTETVNSRRPFMYSSSTYFQEKHVKI